MDVELVIREKLPGESKKAIIACNDYLRMGPGRSLPKLLERYREIPRNTAPTVSLNTLQKWSQTYNWQERAESYDAAIEAEKNAQATARRQEIMRSGVALDYERVEKLRRLADFLEAQIYYEPKIDDDVARLLGIATIAEEDELSDIARIVLSKLDPNDPKAKYPNVWARDVKALAGGKTVDIVRFNPAILAEYRAALDDIAKEVGGRRQRTVTENIDYSKLTEEQLQRVASGEDPIQVILSDYASRQS